MKKRPNKKKFPLKIQKELREEAISFIKDKFISDKNISKIILIGSSINGNFGEYESPGFRGSLYSDFDFIFFIKDDYRIPIWLRREPSGRPFPESRLNLAYRNKRAVDKKYDIEIFFIREKNANNPLIQKLGEKAGIPMVKNSKHKYLVLK